MAAVVAPDDDDYALVDDGTIDVAWLSRKLSKAVESVTVREQSKMGGMSGDRPALTSPARQGWVSWVWRGDARLGGWALL